MNRKEYLTAQGNVQKDVTTLATTLKTNLQYCQKQQRLVKN